MKYADNKHYDGALSPEVMNATDFANWGLSVVAYVRHQDLGNWSIHAADGTAIGAAPTRDTAFAAVRQNDLEPVSVH